MGGDHADVLIIGAGPSGGAVGRCLVDAGFSVVCLEQGNWPDRAAYRGGELDWELTGLKQWAMNPNVREGPTDYSIDVTDSDYGILNFNGVGGATTLFNVVWPRFTPSNFQTRSGAGYASDWPIGYQDLLPYYERTDREVGASGLAGNPLYPPGADFPLPPLPMRKGGLLMARAFTRLGWHWWPETNAILSAPYDGRNPCVQRGTCNQGCGEGAKGTADLTFWRHVVAGGGRVETGARVSQLVLDDSGLVAGAEWFDSAGRGHFQSADVVLCAANGVGTPRLLLASACSRFPDGLANGSGYLGRNLMFHGQSLIKAIFPDRAGESARSQRLVDRIAALLRIGRGPWFCGYVQVGNAPDWRPPRSGPSPGWSTRLGTGSPCVRRRATGSCGLHGFDRRRPSFR